MGQSSSPCNRDCLHCYWGTLTLSSKYCMNYMCWVSCTELSTADKGRCSVSCEEGTGWLNLTPPEDRTLAWFICQWIHRREATLTDMIVCFGLWEDSKSIRCTPPSYLPCYPLLNVCPDENMKSKPKLLYHQKTPALLSVGLSAD